MGAFRQVGTHSPYQQYNILGKENAQRSRSITYSEDKRQVEKEQEQEEQKTAEEYQTFVLRLEARDSVLKPTYVDYFDRMLLCCLFRDATANLIEPQAPLRSGIGETQVQVLATILQGESPPQEGRQESPIPLEKKIKESFFVGEVQYGARTLRSGTLVTSFLKCPVRANILNLDPNTLIDIPPKLDCGEAVSIVSTFLPMFAALHHGRENAESRFSCRSLQGKFVLISGGKIEEADALVKLARHGGAAKIFVLQSREALRLYHVGFHNVILIENNDPTEWQARLPMAMDVVVHLDYPHCSEAVMSRTKKTGRMVCRAPEESDDWYSTAGNIMSQLGMVTFTGVSMFDFADLCKGDYNEVVKDLHYLLNLLRKRKIRPLIDKYIKKEDVDVIRDDMRRHPAAGVVICENR